MSLRFPLSVRINDGVVDRFVTAKASNLQFVRTAPGGFQSISLRLNLDPGELEDLGPADRIWVYGPNGAVLCEGFIENPGAFAGPEGVGFDVTATGTMILASDQARALVYIERNLGDWTAYAKNVAASSASTSDDPNNVSQEQGLLTQFNRGNTVGANLVAQIGYSTLAMVGMQFGGLSTTFKSGKNDANYSIELAYSGPGVTSGASVLRADLSTTTRTNGRYVGETGAPPVGTNAVALRMKRTGGATTIGDDDTWTWFESVAVLGRRMNRFGNLLTGAAGLTSVDSVRADQVVEDLVGRMLTPCDPAAVNIETSTYAIDQLAYTDPVTASDVLGDLEVYEPDFLWEFGASTAAGYAFNYRAWPTTVRYEISTKDGYDAPGGDVDLCNRITVRWVDNKGKDRVTVVTAASAAGVVLPGDNPTPTVFSPSLKALEDRKRIHDAEPITLPAGRGSAQNALRAGNQALAAKVDPPKAARATVIRAIPDLLRGGVALPYELEPGYLVRVRETGDVLRLTEVEVDDEQGEARLTLGEPVLTDEQRLNMLAKVARRKAA